MNDADEGIPGKTGQTDESILLDRCPFIIPLIELLKAAKRDHDPLWQFDM